jgi:hypothetical protein
MVMPTTSRPSATSMAAAAAESTPPERAATIGGRRVKGDKSGQSVAWVKDELTGPSDRLRPMVAKPLLTVLLCLSLFACDDDPSVSLVGKSTPEQSADIADAICERNVDCGEVNVSCDNDGCVGTIVEVDYQECINEETPEIQDDLLECDLADEDLRAVEDCLNELLSYDCPTQAEVDAAIENDEPLIDFPPICIAAFALLDDCS